MSRKLANTIACFALVVVLGGAGPAHALDVKTPYPSMAPLEATELIASAVCPASKRALAKKSTSPCSLVVPVPWAACGEAVGGEEAATGAWAVMATLMIEFLQADYIVLTTPYDTSKPVLL